MSYDETLVGSIAFILAIVALAAAVGPWSSPYQLRTVAWVCRRFGKPIARVVWVAVSIACLAAGLAIVNGIRPDYATPAERATLDRD